MSDMEETEETSGSVSPRRVIGTPPAAPRLLGSSAATQDRDTGEISDAEGGGEHFHGHLPTDPASEAHARRAEKVVAACFNVAFVAGCGFNAAWRSVSAC